MSDDTRVIPYIYNHIQIVNPPIPWNWVNKSGETSYPQIQFCDTVPGSISNGLYQSSSNYFAQGYADLVSEMLKTGFKPSKQLKDTIEINKEPTSQPGNIAAPVGWTKTKVDNEALTWKRAWNISKSSEEFRISNQSQKISQNKLVFSEKKKDGQTQLIGELYINSKAVETILISAGKWYSSLILKKAAKASGTNLDDPDDYDIYFGKNEGLLSCRIKSLVAALMPSGDTIYVPKGEHIGNQKLKQFQSDTNCTPYIVAVFLDVF